MPADVGNQKIAILYHTIANSSEVNLRHVSIRQLGIYKGGYLSIVDTSNAQVSPLICEISDGTYQIRGETTSTVNLVVAQATPYVVLRWLYLGVTSDYMELLAVDTPASNDLVIGKCSFTGGGDLQGFDYSERSTPNTQDLFLKVEAPDSTMVDKMKVRVRAGRIQINDYVKQINDQPTGVSFTHSGGGSTEYGLVYIDTSGNVQIVDASGNILVPNYNGKMVLAEVAITSAIIAITQDMITDVRNWIAQPVTSDETQYLSTFNNVVQLVESGAFAKADLGTIKKQNDIAVANSQITLTANRKYLLSYMISGSPTLANTSDPHLQARWAVVSGDNSWDLENVSLSLTECAYDGGHQVRTSISNTSYIIPSETTVIQLECWTQQDASQKSYVLDLNVNIISID